MACSVQLANRDPLRSVKVLWRNLIRGSRTSASESSSRSAVSTSKFQVCIASSNNGQKHQTSSLRPCALMLTGPLTSKSYSALSARSEPPHTVTDSSHQGSDALGSRQPIPLCSGLCGGPMHRWSGFALGPTLSCGCVLISIGPFESLIDVGFASSWPGTTVCYSNTTSTIP